MTALRILVGLLSIAVTIGGLGSVWRTWCRRSRPDDALWSLIAVFAAVQSGYFIRWACGWAPPPHTDESVATLLGLQILMALLALRTLQVRFEREGWRW